jgi:hypothetical protein
MLQQQHHCTYPCCMSLPSNVGVISVVVQQRTSWASHKQSTVVRCHSVTCGLAMCRCRSSPVLCFFVTWDLRNPVPLTFFPCNSRQHLQLESLSNGPFASSGNGWNWRRMGCTRGDFCCTAFSSTVRRASLGVHERFLDSLLEPCIGLQIRS